VTDPNPAPAVSSPAAKRGLLLQFIVAQAPYLFMLLLALIGVAYTSIKPAASLLYWQAMAPIFGAICIIMRWSQVGSEKHGRLLLIWTQVLHWGALLLIMRLLFVHDVQQLLNSDITGLVLLYLLALSTLQAGIYIDWRLCVLGVFLGAAPIAIAFLEDSALLLFILGFVIVMVAAPLLWNRFGAKLTGGLMGQG